METIDTFDYLMTHEWRCQPDSTMGGWCITLAEDPRSPSEGALSIASFLAEAVADHIVATHNASIVAGPAPQAPRIPSQKG